MADMGWKERGRYWLWNGLLILQVAMCASAFILSRIPINGQVPFLDVLTLNNLCIFFGLMMYLSLLRAGRFDTMNRRMLYLLFISAAYLFSDGMYWRINGLPWLAVWNHVLNTVYCLCPIVMVQLFWRLLGEILGSSSSFYRRMTLPMEITGLICVLFILGNIFGGYYFTVSMETGLYARGGAYYAFLVLPILMCVCIVVYILISPMALVDRLILLAYPVMPILYMAVRGFTPGFFSLFVFLSLFFFYTNLFVRSENSLLVREKALTESRLRALQLQINPHFLFNTLSSVAGLCESDPPAAQEMVYQLSDYLRDNLVDLTGPATIPFREELTQLEHYLAIERTRFPEIEVRFDIRAEAFLIPSLTLQPLVENAIKHGIRKRRDSRGVITVTSEAAEDAYIVHILDDGVGFSADEAPADGVHIGIQNVRTRLELLCDGTLEVVSAPGRGTACRIRLPKKRGVKPCSRFA